MGVIREILKKDFKNFTPFFVLILLIISVFATQDSYDFYFIADNGREIVTNGFPHTDWVSMHSDLNVVLQQWVVSVINWLLYSTFGFTGVHIWAICVSFILGCLIFFVTLIFSNRNYLLSMLLTLPTHLCIAAMYACPRPQMYSAIIVLLTILILEWYTHYNKTKLLYLLPILSIAHANIHATFWPLTVGIMCFYVVVSFIYKYKNKQLLILTVISLMVGLINPWGLDALIQPLFTRGYLLYTVISELGPAGVKDSLIFIIVPLMAISVLITYNIMSKRNIKNKIPLIIMAVVSNCAAIGCYRLAVYGVILSTITIGSLCDFYDCDCKRPPFISNLATFTNGLLLSAMTIFIIFSSIIMDLSYPLKNTEFRDLDAIKDIIAKDESPENETCISLNVVEGQYLHFFTGIHPYMEGRLEIYIDSVNKKEDYSTKFYYATKKDPTIFMQLVEQYEIDYVVLEADANFGTSIAKMLDGKYELLYPGTDRENGNEIYQLWKKKT